MCKRSQDTAASERICRPSSELTEAQHDGTACAICHASDQPMVPIEGSQSKYNSQLFRCASCPDPQVASQTTNATKATRKKVGVSRRRAAMHSNWHCLTDTQRARASECISFMRRGIPERRAYRLTGAKPAHVKLLGSNRGPAFIPTPEEIAAECKRLLAARPPIPERAHEPPSDGVGIHRVTVTHYAA